MRTAAFLCLLINLLVPTESARSANAVAPVSGPWDAGAFDFSSHSKKMRRALSGIACSGPVGAPCLVVFDEGVEARYVTLSSTGYVIDNTSLPLRNSDEELDAEGASTDGKYFYVTGSHSAKRKTCESNPGSRYVLRFPIDPVSGKAVPSDRKETGALWSLMSSLPALADHVGEQKCLGREPPPKAPELKGQRGVNIEGIAARDGQLHFGFRGPTKNATAPILTTNAREFFETPAPKASVTFVEVGEGRGIRDLAPVKDGILVLAGPDDDTAHENVGWFLGLWDGRPTDVAKLKDPIQLDLSGVKLRSCDEELKPEALAILRDDPDAYEVVIMSDGMCDGGPMKFVLTRTP
ncbi:DUF3616 domain-containing protein [Bradyrhizobium sp. CCBAU 53338]|uniref:DUF3616 domain-containing protein n=1 Tax=Bradyrhizobium sp. CCBAU 53338 TaxID=1325111 RepID=UPI00188D0802|nr:DUF3616 domain-containing protein [Bradyrhizobium sp. CCBAU 53338]QOZ51519.1 hypothetical protein XH90_09105 [Bradyrhizobium sp. CCBAU 53338]